MISHWKQRIGHGLQILAAVLLCEGVGLVAAAATQTSVTTWYPTLQKPGFTPPDWLFAPVWTVLYAMMGVAAVLIWWRRGEDARSKTALRLFSVQLIVNGAWSFAFFWAQSPGFGLVVILVLLGLVAWTTVRFYQLRAVAGLLLVPYLLWVTYATVLNGGIWILNG